MIMEVRMENTGIDSTSWAQELTGKIRSRTARVGVVGLGYVGLPLAVEFAKAGFSVTGIDIDEAKVAQVNAGDSYVLDVPSAVLGSAGGSRQDCAPRRISSASRELDTVNICVPTPLRKTKDPDMSYIDAACREIAKHIHPGMLIILESTTYPGTTDEFVLPMLEESGLRVGRDFFLCFSPERVDPGNPKYQTGEHPQGGGRHHAGLHPRSGALFYSQALEQVVPVSSTQVAEMVKLLENTFRMINIGLVNEMALMCDRMGINVWEVIDAAATKPFGFMPFYPGPGPGRALHPHRPVLSLLEDQAGGHRGALHRAGGLHQRPDAALRGGQGAERAERPGQAAEGLAHPRHGRGLQEGHRRPARIAGAGRDASA